MDQGSDQVQRFASALGPGTFCDMIVLMDLPGKKWFSFKLVLNCAVLTEKGIVLTQKNQFNWI